MKLVAVVTLLFFLVFTAVTSAGILLTYAAVSTTTENPDSSNSLKLKIGRENIEAELSTGIPGLVITVMGFVGLVLLLRRVPVREVLGYETRGGGGRDVLGLMTRTPILSHEESRIPLLVWWIVKKKGLYVRSDINA